MHLPLVPPCWPVPTDPSSCGWRTRRCSSRSVRMATVHRHTLRHSAHTRIRKRTHTSIHTHPHTYTHMQHGWCSTRAFTSHHPKLLVMVTMTVTVIVAMGVTPTMADRRLCQCGQGPKVRPHVCIHARSHMDMHIHLLAFTHIRTRFHTRAHAHTHTHPRAYNHPQLAPRVGSTHCL